MDTTHTAVTDEVPRLPGGRLRALGAAVLMVAALLVGLAPGPAWAHASLIDSSPRQDERLETLPAEVRFEFSEDLAPPAYVIVTAPDGTSVTTGDPRIDGPVVTQDLLSGPGGTYTMAYRAVSKDGHPVTGEITFVVGGGRGVAESPDASVPSTAESGPADPTTDPAPAQASDGSVATRDLVAVSVGIGLFLLAALMMLLARRTSP